MSFAAALLTPHAAAAPYPRPALRVVADPPVQSRRLWSPPGGRAASWAVLAVGLTIGFLLVDLAAVAVPGASRPVLPAMLCAVAAALLLMRSRTVARSRAAARRRARLRSLREIGAGPLDIAPADRRRVPSGAPRPGVQSVHRPLPHARPARAGTRRRSGSRADGTADSVRPVARASASRPRPHAGRAPFARVIEIDEARRSSKGASRASRHGPARGARQERSGGSAAA